MDQSESSSAGLPSNRACNACRANKTRCLPNPDGVSRACQRCTKTDRQCIFTVSSRRKPRKRTDTRVAELEKEVQAMKTLFESKAKGNSEVAMLGDDPFGKAEVSNSDMGSFVANQDSHTFTPPALQPSTVFAQENTSTYHPGTDVIDRDILSEEEAYGLFRSFNSNFLRHFPCLVLPDNFTAEECRRTKPILFLAILAAAAAESNFSLYSTLNTEVLTAYAHRTVLNHEKSLELVQAMLVFTIWYYRKRVLIPRNSSVEIS